MNCPICNHPNPYSVNKLKATIQSLQDRLDAAYEVVNNRMDCECEENPGECVSCGILRALEGEP